VRERKISVKFTRSENHGMFFYIKQNSSIYFANDAKISKVKTEMYKNGESAQMRRWMKLRFRHIIVMRDDYVRGRPAVFRQLVRARTGRLACCDGKSNCLEIARIANN